MDAYYKVGSDVCKNCYILMLIKQVGSYPAGLTAWFGFHVLGLLFSGFRDQIYMVRFTKKMKFGFILAELSLTQFPWAFSHVL